MNSISKQPPQTPSNPQRDFNPFRNSMNPASYQSQNSTFPPQAPLNPQHYFNPFRNSMNLASYQSQSSTCPPGFNPFRNSILAKRRDIVEGQTPIRPKAKRQRIAEIPSVSEALESAVGLLEEEFWLRKTASQAFPPDISSSHIRSAISRYEDAMTAASDRSICCSCAFWLTQMVCLSMFIHQKK